MLCSTFFQLAIFSSPVYPFEAWELNIFLTKIQGGTAIHNEWIKLNAGEDIQSFADFVKIYAFFRKAQGEFGVRNVQKNGVW